MSSYSMIQSYDGSPNAARAKLNLDVRYLIAPLVVFWFTIWIDYYYTGGDPSLYRYVYDALGTESFDHGFFFYSQILSSTEPVYYLFVWTLAHLGVPREIFIGASSAALALLSTMLLVRRGGSLIIATIITSSSFYFLLLYSTTERLKIAIIFLVASVLLQHRPKLAMAFAFLAIAAHIQVSLIYFSLLMIYLVSQLRQFYETRVLPPNAIGTAVIIVCVVFGSYYAIADQISAKFISYVGLGQDSDLLRVLPLYVITLIYANSRITATLLFIPLIILTPVIGYGRLNIFSYFIFLYYAMETRRGFNVGVVLTTLYFVYSSYAFIDRIIQFGDPLQSVQ